MNKVTQTPYFLSRLERDGCIVNTMERGKEDGKSN